MGDRSLLEHAGEIPDEGSPALDTWRSGLFRFSKVEVFVAFEHILRQSREDGLTGLLRQPAFRNIMESVLQRARGNGGKTASVLMIDADHFKEVNDGPGGHAAGDKALVLLAKAMRKAGRPTDVVCRRGGDEFAVLLPNTNCANAVAVAERIRKQVAGDLSGFGVTVSVGVACTGRTFDPDTLIDTADKALRAAKDEGKDRVRFRS